jgi:hypothetical protein
MGAQANHTVWSAYLSAAADAVSVGTCLMLNEAGTAYIVATAANRAATSRRSAGVALTAGSAVYRAVEMQTVGVVPASVTGLGAGAAGAIRVGSDGRLERGSGGDEVGRCDADGTAYVLFGGAASGGGGGSSLPEVTTANNGDVLTVVDGYWSAAEAGAPDGIEGEALLDLWAEADPYTLTAGEAANRHLILDAGTPLDVLFPAVATAADYYERTVTNVSAVALGVGPVGGDIIEIPAGARRILGFPPGGVHVVASHTASGGGTTPTGTGLRKVVSGVEDAAASLLVNADVSASAAIAGTKVAPNFGSQTVQTTGNVSVGATPAGSGAVRLANSTAIAARNASDTADLTIASTTSGDNMNIWGTSAAHGDVFVNFPAAQSLQIQDATYWRQYVTQLGTQFGGSPSFGGGAGVIGVTNARTVPTSNPAGGAVWYVESGASKARGSSGTVTTFGPADPHCPSCGRDFATEQRNDDLGEHVAVCIPCLLDTLAGAGIDITKFAFINKRGATKAQWDAAHAAARAKEEAAMAKGSKR